MIRLGSDSISSWCLYISTYRVCKHSVCGMEAYRLFIYVYCNQYAVYGGIEILKFYDK